MLTVAAGEIGVTVAVTPFGPPTLRVLVLASVGAALVAAAQIDPSFKQSIQSRTSLADLIEYLQLVPDQVTQALVTAIPKKG